MKFTVSTKPFADSLNLGVINANISKFNQKSYIAQLTATKDTLKVNLEASRIASQIILKGSGDEDGPVTVFVDCSVLKSIVNTFETAVTTIEFIDGGVILHAGSSKFNLAQIVDSKNGRLASISEELPPDAISVKLNKDDWKFLDSYQMYAVAMSFVYPVYTYVWVGENGEAIVGDFTNSLFTFSQTARLGEKCLLTDTVINLLTSLPEGAEIAKLNVGYRVSVKTDGFEFAAQFLPMFEDDTLDYKAPMLLEQVKKDESNYFVMPVPAIQKFISQAEIVSSGSQEFTTFEVKDSVLCVRDDNIDCKVKVEGNAKDFCIQIATATIKSVLSHLDAESVKVSPIVQEDEIGGLVIWTDKLAVVVGSAEG